MRQFVESKFFMAVIVFGALSCFAGWCKFAYSAPLQFPYRTWTAWAIEDFFKQPKRPDVVFLGSSLVLVPLSGVDADFLNRRLDGSLHHRSVYFERRLADATGCSISSYDFALPGEMPSDACLIANFLLRRPRAPELVVYGVGPRDFMDNLLPSPASTDPFRFLSRFGDISKWSALMMPDWQERLSYELGRAVYFYGKKLDISSNLVAAAASCANALLPPPAKAQSEQASVQLMRELLPQYEPFSLRRGEAFFRPLTDAEAAHFSDNLAEYRKRYKTLKWDTFMTQMYFFAETLSAARRNGSQAVVVAMPITQLNRRLLSDRSWDAYRSSIKAIANREGAAFIDFNNDTSFKQSDFSDTVHLHARGGRKWLDKLIDKFLADQTIVAQLKGRHGNLQLSGKGGTL